MRKDGPFGEASGTRSVEQHGGISGGHLGTDIGGRRGLAQWRKGQSRRTLTFDQHNVSHCGQVDGGEFVIARRGGDQQLCATIVEDKGEFFGFERRVDGDGNRTKFLYTQIGDHKGAGVGQPDRHAVTTLNTQPGKAVSRPVALCMQLVIGKRFPFKQDGRALWKKPRTMFHRLCNIHSGLLPYFIYYHVVTTKPPPPNLPRVQGRSHKFPPCTRGAGAF